MKNKITLVITYYDAPEMLGQQMKYWCYYPDGVKIILVDDGSPNYPAEEVFKEIDLSGLDEVELYRVKEDIFQNLAGARNLGFSRAGGWVINTDIDHVIPPSTMTELIGMDLTPGYCYAFGRLRMKDNAGTEPMHRHQDTYMIRKEIFDGIGGYDEDYVGYYYNASSFAFKQAIKRATVLRMLKDQKILYFGPDVIKDASPLLNQEKKRMEYVKFNKRPIDPLRFEWEEVKITKEMV